MAKEEIDASRLLQYLNDMNAPMTKRDMAKAFGLKGSERIMLKDAIRDLMDQGKIKKTAQKTYVTAGEDHLPAVAVFKIVEAT